MAVHKVGILTAGGDSPGLNAAIRGFGKAAIGLRHGGRRVPGRVPRARGGPAGQARPERPGRDPDVGGTILGTSRDKPHRMLVDGEVAT